MAVPLGGPRMDGGLRAPVTVATPGGPVTSTPVSRTQVTAGKNVTMVSVAADDRLIDQKPEPELSKQVKIWELRWILINVMTMYSLNIYICIDLVSFKSNRIIESIFLQIITVLLALCNIICSLKLA